MSDEHRASSFPESKPRVLSSTEKATLKPKPPEPKQPTRERLVAYLKEKGFSFASKSLWYKVGEKKRRGKPPAQLSIGAGRRRHGSGAGIGVRVDF